MVKEKVQSGPKMNLIFLISERVLKSRETLDINRRLEEENSARIFIAPPSLEALVKVPLFHVNWHMLISNFAPFFAGFGANLFVVDVVK